MIFPIKQDNTVTFTYFYISTVWIRRSIGRDDAYTAAERGIGAGANADIGAALANGNRFAVGSDEYDRGFC